MAKPIEAPVEEILKMLASGAKRKDIAKQFGISVGYLSKIAIRHGYRKNEVSDYDLRGVDEGPTPKYFIKHKPNLFRDEKTGMVVVNDLFGEIYNTHPQYRTGASHSMVSALSTQY